MYISISISIFHSFALTNTITQTIYGGISVCSNDNNEVVISLAVRDTTYFLDFSEHRFPIDERAHPSADVITDFVLLELRRYEHEHLEKFVGMALPRELAERCPHLCPRLWRELDIVPLVLHGKGVHSVGWINREYWDTKTLDEQAESVARKCITYVLYFFISIFLLHSFLSSLFFVSLRIDSPVYMSRFLLFHTPSTRS